MKTIRTDGKGPTMSELAEKSESYLLIEDGLRMYNDMKDIKINDNITYGQLNHFNEEANTYDKKLEFVTKRNKCYMEIEDPSFIYFKEYDCCYCSCCVVRKKLLDMIQINRDKGIQGNVIFDLKGIRLNLILIEDIPIVKKRDDRMYVVVESNIKGFNYFYPVDYIFKSFYNINRRNYLKERDENIPGDYFC